MLDILLNYCPPFQFALMPLFMIHLHRKSHLALVFVSEARRNPLPGTELFVLSILYLYSLKQNQTNNRAHRPKWLVILLNVYYYFFRVAGKLFFYFKLTLVAGRAQPQQAPAQRHVGYKER